ncbi:serine/threonine-protein kinase [Salmonirosea aquatica]|uniref:Protein kinase n=1 Tax=Salmonirosea aquatica TaxID=2654236 RepID=A0A7C9FMZ8_9BACT|nr:protein kinase [Cytophagaceae bacterium SJW1-29]
MNVTFTSYSDFSKRYPIQFGDDSSWLGTGTYGKVIKVEDQVETEWVAIKISEYRYDDAKSLKAEVELAQKVPRHANIARYDACYRLETEVGVSDFAIMKYYPEGNLADLLKSRRLSDAELRELVGGILEGLKVLHQKRIVHRDFKPANILISRDNRGRLIPKIADFGLSKFVSDDEIDRSDFDLSDGRGTPSYKAPEQIMGGRVSFNLDLWAFGVILYEMITGEKPFTAGSQSTEPTQRRELERRITTVQLPERLDAVPEPYQSMIRLCLVRDIRQRVRKPDELLVYLEKPTRKPDTTSQPAQPLLAEEYTDVYVPSATALTKQIGPDQGTMPATDASGKSSRGNSVWLWSSLGGGTLLIAFLIWSMKPPVSSEINELSASGTVAPKDIFQEIATNDSPKSEEERTTKVPLEVPATKVAIVQNQPKNESNQIKDLPSTEQSGNLIKRQLQAEYEDLIQKGNELINSTNNKPAAMELFNKARQLAAENDLNAAKGNASYTYYYDKGNRIYENGAYEGAKAWFKLAQSLHQTEEVGRRIRDCEINQ